VRSVQPASKVLKIAAMRDGRITADGSPTTIKALQGTLKDLATSEGIVWYYREGAEAEPHPNASEVVDAIIEHSLPVSLSSKSDYSDEVDENGKSHPGQ
jgi:hypothetical protein